MKFSQYMITWKNQFWVLAGAYLLFDSNYSFTIGILGSGGFLDFYGFLLLAHFFWGRHQTTLTAVIIAAMGGKCFSPKRVTATR